MLDGCWMAMGDDYGSTPSRAKPQTRKPRTTFDGYRLDVGHAGRWGGWKEPAGLVLWTGMVSVCIGFLPCLIGFLRMYMLAGTSPF